MTDFRRITQWAFGPDTGASSRAIVDKMAGLNNGLCCAPLDPADLGRCLRLLEIFPEWKARIPEMASVSPEWAKAAACWDEISASMEAEVGIDWSKGRRAPKTYALMKERGL